MSQADRPGPPPPFAAPPAAAPSWTIDGRVNALLAEAAGHAAAGRWDEAAASHRMVLRLGPNRAEAWDALGGIAYNAGRHEESERLFRRAVALQPDNANYRDHLGVALRALGRPAEAVEQYEKALELSPNRAGTLNNLGNALAEAGTGERGVEALRRAVALAPREPAFRMNLARALMTCERAQEALAEIDQVRASSSHRDIDFICGNALISLQRFEEAIAAYRRAEAAGVRDHIMFHNLGTALQVVGRSEEAAEAYRTALAIRPDFASTRRQLTATHKYESLDREAEQLEEQLKAPGLNVADRADLHMGLAKIFDDLGNYGRAFFHLQAGNQHIRSTIDYSADVNADYIDAVIETFDRGFFAKRPGFGLGSEVPLFIVGMPRSGTTLVEQILASHAEVHGAGELKKLYELFGGLRQRLKPDLGMPRIARLIDRGVAGDVGREYLDYLTSFAPFARVVTDKMPFNFRVLGLVALLFPKARIIHCRRDPRDVGLSCYFARFHSEMTFAFNLVEIGRYYRDYERLMEHWREVLHNPMLEVQYEELVADLENETRRMLAFCGLEWDERCLRYYDTERPVQTASNWQVRQPVYTSSVGRWRHYREYLEPFFVALAIDGDGSPPSGVAVPSPAKIAATPGGASQ